MGKMQVGVMSSSNSSFAIGFYLLAFFLVLLLAYLATKFIAQNQGVGGNRNIKIIERTFLGNDRTLLLYELEKVYYLMYIHKNGATLIDKRTDLESLSYVKKQKKIEFSDVLRKFSNKEEGSKGDDE